MTGQTNSPTLAGTLAMLVVVMFLADRASVLGWVRWPRSPAALEDSAREILGRVGHQAAALDHATLMVGFHDSYRRYIRASDQSPRRWDVLKQPGQWDVYFIYRQASTVMVPFNPFGRVDLNDFNILAANFGQSPRTFTQGDFNYDNTVNLEDFNILAGRFGAAVAAHADARPADSLTRKTDVGDDEDILHELS